MQKLHDREGIIPIQTRTLESLKWIIAEQFKQILETQAPLKVRAKEETVQTPINSIKSFMNNIEPSPKDEEKIEVLKSNLSINHF